MDILYNCTGLIKIALALFGLALGIFIVWPVRYAATQREPPKWAMIVVAFVAACAGTTGAYAVKANCNGAWFIYGGGLLAMITVIFLWWESRGLIPEHKHETFDKKIKELESRLADLRKDRVDDISDLRTASRPVTPKKKRKIVGKAKKRMKKVRRKVLS